MSFIYVPGGGGGGGGDLLAANNLSDVANAATSLANLGGVGAATVPFFPHEDPAAIAADQNNYDPVTSAETRIARLQTSGGADRTLTGLAPTGGNDASGDGRHIALVNLGPDNIILSHQDAASTAGNRFLMSGGASLTLATNESVTLWHDPTTNRWRDI